MDLATKIFEGKEIKFRRDDGELYMNVNSIADKFMIDNWKRSANTIRYIKALVSSLESTEFNKDKSRKFNNLDLTLDNVDLNTNYVKSTEFIITQEGRNGGTWIHEKLILSFARYISVEFEIWADEVIKKVIQDGYYISEKINIDQINKLEQTLNNMEIDLNLVKTSLFVARDQRDEFETKLNKTSEYKADYNVFNRKLAERDETIREQNKMLAIARWDILVLKDDISVLKEDK